MKNGTNGIKNGPFDSIGQRHFGRPTPRTLPQLQPTMADFQDDGAGDDKSADAGGDEDMFD